MGKDKTELSPIDAYISEAAASDSAHALTAGSLYTKAGIFSDLSRDLQARQVNDIVTIIVSDRASAVSRGVTNTGRKSSAKSSVSSLLGALPQAGALAGLAELGGSSQLQGQGETSRETTLTTTISARVTHVLPNGYLVVQGEKQIWVNSERQQVTIRGVVRWNDIGSGNEVASDRLANLEVRVNGKGVVGDAIKRPNILYRLLLGILPF
jgi:flagellar L-ring protein precursor FlgH